MRPRHAAVVGLAWAVLTWALHLMDSREHVAVLAGATGSALQITIGLATVIVQLAGVLVLGPWLLFVGITAIADRVRLPTQPQARSSQLPHA